MGPRNLNMAKNFGQPRSLVVNDFCDRCDMSDQSAGFGGKADVRLFLNLREYCDIRNPEHDHTDLLYKTLKDWPFYSECGDHYYFSLLIGDDVLIDNAHIRTPCPNPFLSLPVLTVFFMYMDHEGVSWQPIEKIKAALITDED